jgi:Ser/Thr protein kinase RdoA (MazF antagonist)
VERYRDPVEAEDALELPGSTANHGRVVRIGRTVRRPPRPIRLGVRDLLEHLAGCGFPAPVPLGVDEEGREVYEWIEGEVATSPFPAWALTDEALASVGRLLRRYHDAAADFRPPREARWASDLADPGGGALVCHNDVCPENVVFRDGEAYALLDFDYAAPGRAVWDLSAAARMWIPLRPPERPDPRSGLDRPRRLAILARAYGLTADDHEQFLDAIVAGKRVGSSFVRGRVAVGDVAFVEMWRRRGGAAGNDRIVEWLEASREEFLAALR